MGGGIPPGGAGNTQTFTAGDTVHIAAPLTAGGSTNDNSLTFADGATIDGATSASFEAARTFSCFATGTRIETPDGARPVQNLRAGDLVLTRDCGPRR